MTKHRLLFVGRDHAKETLVTCQTHYVHIVLQCYVHQTQMSILHACKPSVTAKVMASMPPGLSQAGFDPASCLCLQIYLANEIERRYGSQGLHATSVHPGGIFTELARHVDMETVKAMMTPGAQLVLKSPEQGAATTVWAVTGKHWEGQVCCAQLCKTAISTTGISCTDPSIVDLSG